MRLLHLSRSKRRYGLRKTIYVTGHRSDDIKFEIFTKNDKHFKCEELVNDFKSHELL